MAFQIDSRMDPRLSPLAWMIGHWEGTGNGQIDGRGFEYGVTIDVSENGGNYLHYIMQWFQTDAQGHATASLGLETGFWRPQADGVVELVMAHPEGYAEIYLGQIDGAKIALTTDVVARTVTADPPVSGGHRLYGNVESDLLFTYDRGTADQPLGAYLWARLKRMS